LSLTKTVLFHRIAALVQPVGGKGRVKVICAIRLFIFTSYLLHQMPADMPRYVRCDQLLRSAGCLLRYISFIHTRINGILFCPRYRFACARRLACPGRWFCQVSVKRIRFYGVRNNAFTLTASGISSPSGDADCQYFQALTGLRLDGWQLMPRFYIFAQSGL